MRFFCSIILFHNFISFKVSQGDDVMKLTRLKISRQPYLSRKVSTQIHNTQHDNDWESSLRAFISWDVSTSRWCIDLRRCGHQFRRVCKIECNSLAADAPNECEFSKRNQATHWHIQCACELMQLARCAYSYSRI